MRVLCGRLFALLLAQCALAAIACAQTPDRGFTAIESFQGELNSSEKLMKFDSNIGYDFNKHFGVFAGIPFYIANTPATSATATTTASPGGTVSGIGNAYLGFALRAPSPILNYVASVTANAPTGDTSKGLSTGRVTVDWSNHFDKSFNRLTPFFDVGLGNSVPDSALLTRAFTSLGGVSHLQEGAEFDLAHHFSVGGSGYQVFPFGNQKVFSKVSNSGGPGSGGAGGNATSGKGHGSFQDQFLSSGTGLTRENGVSTWVALEPAKHLWRAELGFSRSITFDLNSFSFNLGLNIGKMLRSRSAS